MSAKRTPGHVPEDCPIERCPECAGVFAAREAKKKALPMGDPTPGPWQHVVNGRGYDVRTVTAGLGEPIANRVMRAPDAYLIAAAPDLLEVAQSVVLRGHSDGCASVDRRHCDCLFKVAAAAVSKAHGESGAKP